MMVNGNQSIRELIRSILLAIVPLDQHEQEQIEFACRWIDSGAEIFRLAKPATPPIHLVSYFVVTDHLHDEFLLVDHRNAELWLPPGGHVEPGEHPKETVIREAKEELGIDAKFLFHDPLFLSVSTTVGVGDSHTDVSLWYVLKETKGKTFYFDEKEFEKVSWFPREHIPYHRSDPCMSRFVEKLRRKLADEEKLNYLISIT